LPPRDGRDLARVLLDRADDDITLVRHVVDDAEIADAIVGFHAQPCDARAHRRDPRLGASCGRQLTEPPKRS
jgi:hypothetical protein